MLVLFTAITLLVGGIIGALFVVLEMDGVPFLVRSILLINSSVAILASAAFWEEFNDE